MNDTFRVRKGDRKQAVVFLLGFCGMMVASVWVAVAERNPTMMVVLGGFWGSWTGLAAWTLFAYLRISWSIRDDTITYHGAIRAKSVALPDIVEVTWRVPRTIVLRSRSEKVTIPLGLFEPEQRERLIRLFHGSTPGAVHWGWDRFCYTVALPLVRRSDESPPQEPQEDGVLLTRRHFDRLFIACAPLILAAAIGSAWYLQQVRWLFLPVPFAIMWLAFRATHSAKGRFVPRDATIHTRFFLGLVIYGVVALAGTFLLNAFEHHLPYPSWWLVSWALLCFCALLVYAYRADKQRWRDRQGQIESAVREWERREAV